MTNTCPTRRKPTLEWCGLFGKDRNYGKNE